MLKKILLLIVALCFPLGCFANDNEILKEQSIQNRITNVGTRILNANKIQNRIVFVYDKNETKEKLKLDKTLLNRQIVVWGYDYKFVENDDELAAFLSRKIAEANRSYLGMMNGRISSLQIKAAPKKYQLVFDKMAVSYMSNAGYNPIGLITFINKAYPQKRSDGISTENLTSKRLAKIYEYIYTKYPYYIKNNPYFESESYQNFLLTSRNNRKMLEDKVRSRSSKELKYE